MATRYKAKSGGTSPDLDLLDTMWDENEQVHTKSAAVAKEASRGALDFYRLKAAPPADPAALRAALTHALGGTLAAKVLKQASSGVLAQALARLGMACDERAKTDGDQAIADYIDKVTAHISPTQATAGGTLADDEKATKEVRNSFDAQMGGVSQYIQRTGGNWQ